MVDGVYSPEIFSGGITPDKTPYNYLTIAERGRRLFDFNTIKNILKFHV